MGRAKGERLMGKGGLKFKELRVDNFINIVP